jgi:hypothetical protein
VLDAAECLEVQVQHLPPSEFQVRSPATLVRLRRCSDVEIMEGAEFSVAQIEDHGDALLEMVRQIQGTLLGAEIVAGLKKFGFPKVKFPEANGIDLLDVTDASDPRQWTFEFWNWLSLLCQIA